MLFTLIKNELIKIFKRGKTWVILILFAVLISGLSYVFKISSDYMEFYNSTEGQIESLETTLEYEKEWLEEVRESGDTVEIQYSEEYIKNLESELASLQSIVDNKEDPDNWKKVLIQEKKQLQEVLNDETIPDSYKSYEKTRIEEIDMYLEKDVKPIEEWEFDAVNFGIQFMGMIGMIILASGIALFMSDIVSGECTPATLKFLLVQPISRGKVLLSKFISVVITVVGFIGGLEIIVFGVLSAIAGNNAWSMPAFVGQKFEWSYSEGAPTLSAIADSGHYITRGEALIQGFALQMLFILACCAFVFLISCIFKSSMVTMAISVVITVATTMIATMSSTVGKYAHLLFLSYANTPSIVTGDIAYMYQNTNFSIGFGVVVLLLTTVVCYVIGHVVFNKKDILI